MRIRHYGLLVHRGRGKRLAQCRTLLAQRTSGNGAALATTASVAVPSPSATAPAGPLSASATAPSLAPILLLVALTSPAPANPTMALLRAADPNPTTPPTSERVLVLQESICRVCGKGQLEITWHAERPRGRDFERSWSWNTS